MKKITISMIGGVILYCLILMGGCSSSKLTDVWSDPAVQSTSMHWVLVISVSKNSEQRRTWEDGFADELAKHNIAATPSYRLFPDGIPDSNQIMSIMRSHGFDGVLVTLWIPPDTRTQYLQGYVTKKQDMEYYRSTDRFATYYRDIEHAGNINAQKIGFPSIDLWTTKYQGELIWSASSKTSAANSTQAVRPEIVDHVISELTQRGIIAPDR